MTPIGIRNYLLSLPRRLKRAMVTCCDILFCGLSVWIAFGLRLDQWGFLQAERLMVFLTATGFSLSIFFYFGLYHAVFRYASSVTFLYITYAFIIYGGISILIFTLIGVDGVPRSIGVIQPLLYYVGICSNRYVIYRFLNYINIFHASFNKTRIIALIYGAGVAGRQLALNLVNNKQILVKGFIDDNSILQGNKIDGVFIYPSARVKDLIFRLNVTDIFLAIPSVSHERRRDIISSLNGCGVRVRTLPRLSDAAHGRISISDLHDLDMNDLLGRAVVPPVVELLEKNILGKVILITGAGGSIGSELCRQIIKLLPKSLILVDCSEHSLYKIYEELKKDQIALQDNFLNTDSNQNANTDAILSPRLIPCLASVRDYSLMLNIIKTHKPFIVFHAAAYKHVPMVEQNLSEGIRNNVFGTLTCAQVSLECETPYFILVSTDKAVRPKNVMGASKRIAELVLQAMADFAPRSTIFSMVRFGNVLGSSGSVAPLFSKQIATGGPITLTHPEVIRYFMTIPEAAQLVIQASSMATGGDVFVLDMGEPVRIYDLAVKMIYLSGNLVRDAEHPHGNIEIVVTGLRPGEKLYEELLIGDNPEITAHPKILRAHEDFLPWNTLQQELEKLNLALNSSDTDLIKGILKRLVPGYQPDSIEVKRDKESNKNNQCIV
jgi:FlaA1/EpsC-like NDP-sugar epimerase